MIQLDVVNVGMLAGSGNIVLVLREMGGERLLIMEIGPLEANAIAMAMEGVTAPRPLTHDLFATVLGELDVRLDSVSIVDFTGSTFHALLNLDAPAGPLSLDARPSDCIALALRKQAPIYVQPEVLERAGVAPEEYAVEETEEDRETDDGEDDAEDDEGGPIH